MLRQAAREAGTIQAMQPHAPGGPSSRGRGVQIAPCLSCLRIHTARALAFSRARMACRPFWNRSHPLSRADGGGSAIALPTPEPTRRQRPRTRAVIPGGPRSGPGRETRLSCFFRNHTKVWIPFPALRAAGDDMGSALRRVTRRHKPQMLGRGYGHRKGGDGFAALAMPGGRRTSCKRSLDQSPKTNRHSKTITRRREPQATPRCVNLVGLSWGGPKASLRLQRNPT